MTVYSTHWTEELAASMKAVQTEIAAEGNEVTAARFGDLIERLEKNPTELSVAFCGLFSAGKSSLINALCDTQTLATGAVPTTATVSEMTLQTDSGRVILMDTPGIDSTDEAHQAAMEAALHKADLVVLVMDYQHVESEDNLAMARALVDQGKPLVLVINQIDKHVDWELSFSDFRQRVERTFREYDIPWRALFCTTTRSSADNELDDFRSYLMQLGNAGDDIVRHGIAVTACDLITQHVTSLAEPAVSETEQKLVDAIGMAPFDVLEGEEWMHARLQALAALDGQVQSRTEAVREFADGLRTEIQRTIELAQIAPYETTEKGRFYIESLRPGFRVGWIGAQAKTAREVDNRLHAFLDDLLERAQKYMLWPVQNRLREAVAEAPVHGIGWSDRLDGLAVQWTPEQSRTLVNDGSLISEQYPYQYVKDVVASIKRQLSAQVNQLLHAWLTDALVQVESDVRAEQTDRDAVQAELKLLQDWLTVIRSRTERRSALQDLLPDWTNPDAAEDLG